jgi:osmotically-inducible protein OsmY
MASVLQRARTATPPRHSGLPAQRREEVVEACAAAQLRRSGYSEIRHVTCRFHEGILCLRGRVSSYYLKQIAQTIVLELENVRETNNQLEVIAPPRPR